MGSTGANRGVGGGRTVFANNTPPSPVTPVNQNNPNVQNQVPTPANTPVTSNAVSNLSQMDDASMAALLQASRGAQLPNFLNDTGVANLTQQFVFQAGINEKPLVLDTNEYNQFMQDNNISASEQLARSVDPVSYRNVDGTNVKLSADQVIDIMRYSRLNYIGGKRGGHAYGYGTYFDQNGGRPTGYGSYNSSTAVAVLNPNTARTITETNLYRQVTSFMQSHPMVARQLGSISTSNQSIYALLMGYNVITDAHSGYHNVLDRSALVYRK